LRRQLLLVATVVSTAVTVIRRRKAQANAELWREATSDTSR
jgi:hypothetical protein